MIGDTLSYLPVAELVHRLVLAVRQHRGFGPFFSRILPAVITLQLKVCLRVELTDRETHRVVLAQVVVRTIASAVISIDPFLGMFLGNDVDDACHCVRTIKCTLRTLHDFYLLDVVRVYQAQVVLTTYVTVDALAVNQYQDVAVAKTVQLHLTAHVALVERKRRRQACKDILQTLSAILAQHLLCDNLSLHRGILQQVACSRTSHHHLLY